MTENQNFLVLWGACSLHDFSEELHDEFVVVVLRG